MTRIHRTIPKKSLNDLDNYSDVITHLEPDTLGCEDKRALGSITTSKDSESDRILVELFQILKDDAVKVLHSIVSIFGELSSGHKTQKVSFHSDPKERQCERMFRLQLHSSYTLAKSCSKFSKPGFSSM